MWDMVMKYFPEPIEWFCTVLAFLIPYIVYKMNKRIHKKYDPPWKQEEEQGG